MRSKGVRKKSKWKKKEESGKGGRGSEAEGEKRDGREEPKKLSDINKEGREVD